MSGAEVILRRDCLDYIFIAHTWHTALVGSHSQLLPTYAGSYFISLGILL
jgi:hypothetical protein